MNKIVVIGPPGAGKTEFANELGEILGIINVFHLDYYFWKPGWIRTTEEERHSIIMNLIQKNKWIIEGNFLNTIAEQISHADTVIWLNPSILICLYRVIKRYFSYFGKERPFIAPGCRDKITLQFLFSIILYKIIDTKKIKEMLAEKNSLLKIPLENSKDVKLYLEKLRIGF